MSDATPPFAFSQFVPGFDFLKGLAGATLPGGAGAAPGLPSLSNWVAPTLSVEELDKRIQELKTVQYWLEQNGHALKATIQALEVQKMTLSTLRGMNVRMEDLASAFTRPEAAAPEPAVAAPSAAAPTGNAEEPAKRAEPAAAGVVDPLQWWNALTQQFQQIASSAMQDAADLKMPAPAKTTKATQASAPTRKPAVARKPAAKNTAAAPRKRATGR